MSKFIKVSFTVFLCLAFFVGCSIGKPTETTPQTTAEETYYFDPSDIGEMDMLGGSPEEEAVVGEVEINVGISSDEGIVEDVIGDIGSNDNANENFINEQDTQPIITEPPAETTPDPYA